MAQIMTQRDGFRQILIEPQRTGNGAGNAADLNGVGHAGAIVVTFGAKKHLGFVHQATKCFAVDDAVCIPLITGTNITFFLGVSAAFRVGSLLCLRRQQILFRLFQSLPNRHILPSCIL